MFPAFRTSFPASILAVALLAGCATSLDIAQQSTKGNLGVEDAHNQILLLNALRAYKRRPMYFTSIATLTGPLGTVSPSATLSLPFGPIQANNALQTTIAADTNRFSVVVLDGQKFTIGFTTPLKSSLLKYYLDQGWPKALILSLMIREITYDPPVARTKKDGKTENIPSLVNYPMDKAQFQDFQTEIQAMLDCGFGFDGKSDEPPRPLGPTLSRDEASGMGNLINAAKEKMAVVQVPGGWNLIKPESQTGIYLKNLADDSCKSLAKNPVPQPAGAEGAGTAPVKQVMHLFMSLFGAEKALEFSTGRADEKSGGAPDGKSGKRTINLYVRSPEAIVYYMGELIRACLDKDAKGETFCATTKVGSNEEKIFNVVRGAGEKSFLSVKYDGEDYAVTSGPNDRSFHTLSLISQLISLQKEAAELPQTAPIRVISQ